MSASYSYILKSPKAIEFYNKNTNLDFNQVNELFIDLIQKITNTITESMSVNEVKSLLNNINRKVDIVEQNMGAHQKYIQMMYERLNEHRDQYVLQMKDIIQNNDKDSDITNRLRDINEGLLEKTTYNIMQQFPKLSEHIYTSQKSLIEISQSQFHEMMNNQKKQLEQNPGSLENIIQNQYHTMSTNMMQTIQNVFNNDSMFYRNNMELRQFLEMQKNSTKKGKESENKLEICLTNAFPNGIITDKSGEGKSCDYLLERNEKKDIMFENKDYRTNVPNEEIRKFTRDVEHQSKHAIMISQNSGIQNKNDFQIDIHKRQLMVFVHFGKYDETKIRMAVNIIDTLENFINTQESIYGSGNVTFTMEELSEINKEYLQFIGQKNQLIETVKKQQKDVLRQLESFEMPQLTSLLNNNFSNVDQLGYKCELCGYNAKNKRALVTHQNKCKKKKMENQNSINAVADDIVVLDNYSSSSSESSNDS